MVPELGVIEGYFGRPCGHEDRKQVASRLSELVPRDKTILIYCNTSSFAAQVAMALRMDGFENVRLMYGGYNGWKARGGVDAHARASKKS